MSKVKNLGRLYGWRRVIYVWKNSMVIYSILAFCILIIAETYSGVFFLKEILFSKLGYALVLFAAVNTQASMLILKLVDRVSDGSFLSIAAAVLSVVGPEYIPLFGELFLVMVIDNHMFHVCVSLLCSMLSWIGVNQVIKRYLLVYGKETEEELMLRKSAAVKERNR